MSIDMDRRYATAQDFREDLERYLRGETPHAVRGSKFRHVRSFLRRHQTIAAYLLAIGLGALLFGIMQYVIG